MPSPSVTRLPSNSLLSRDTPEGRVFDTSTCITETRDRTIVGPPLKLLLHRLREHGTIDIGVSGGLGGKLAIKVGSVKRVSLKVLSAKLTRQDLDAVYLQHWA